MGATRQPAPKTPHPAGLAHWMRRVLKECPRAGHNFSPDPVHDLRVALRRCRSLADGMMTVDPHPDWRAMKKAGRRLFRRLGRLRDPQVMLEWVTQLAPENDPVRARLEPLLASQEQQHKREARAALAQFDRGRWRHWSRTLSGRARRLPPGGPAFEHLALERWQEAYDLHRRAMRTRSQVGWHRVRIGLKRLRYTVENFLPGRAAWLRDLKRLQDLLGEVHDLDVLCGKYFSRSRMFNDAERERWRQLIRKQREKRLAEYRQRMVGRSALWHVWRAGLPEGERLRSSALARLRAWASFTDPRFRHSAHVARLALQLFDGFAELDGLPIRVTPRLRRILHAAAVLHDVGRARGTRGHHKATYKMIRAFPLPLGWTRQEMTLTALVARYHRGAEPRERHAGFGEMSLRTRRNLLWLAGILRLADGLAQPGAGPALDVRVEEGPEAVDIWARGYRENQETAALLGGRKHLLESVLGRRVILRAWGRSTARVASQKGPRVIPALNKRAQQFGKWRRAG